MKVAVGSNSPLKVDSCKLAWPDAMVLPLTNKFESAVPHQPVGKEETMAGAEFRAKCALTDHPGADIWVGIENGMFKQSDTTSKHDVWVDAAAICIVTKGEMPTPEFDLVWTDSIRIPVDDETWEKGPNGEWSVLKDPHAVLTKGLRTRKQFLAEAMLKWREGRENRMSMLV